ncbi:hypothetical protein FTUN_4406 [Frigoriglobus tundricola]|uniref:Uncharacterized protein n=1 Tax=Frigoriglobus tundricola TaxID=2774151 RepID=A0A6M5YTU3_9BACT|nr:hypothetical protein FTUN_4406 [Frigoriglobus tundricola]
MAPVPAAESILDVTFLFGLPARTAARRGSEERTPVLRYGTLAPRVPRGANGAVGRIGEPYRLGRSCGPLPFSPRVCRGECERAA